ncbi:ROK family protein [Pseudoroseicyclus sp. H15]
MAETSGRRVHALSGRDEALLVQGLRHGPRSRGELAELTGWSRNTVAAKLARLIDEGWVHEAPEAQGERGRPTAVYRVNPRAALVLVARFDADGIGCALCTLDGRIAISEERRMPGDLTAEQTVAELDAMLGRMTEASGVPRDLVRTIVIAVPGPVSGMTRTVPWSRVGVLPADLGAHFGMDVVIENDANLMALGMRKEFSSETTLLFILVQTGIGAGLALPGGLHRGLAGWAGEIGHIPVAAAGETPCICGNRGCVAGIAANPALMRQFARPERPVSSVEQMERLVQEGDTQAIVALREAGRNLGEAMTGVVTGLAPDVIAVGGRIARLGDHVITGIRETLALRMPPALSSQIRFAACEDHYIRLTRGAAELALDVMVGGRAE